MAAGTSASTTGPTPVAFMYFDKEGRPRAHDLSLTREQLAALCDGDSKATEAIAQKMVQAYESAPSNENSLEDLAEKAFNVLKAQLSQLSSQDDKTKLLVKELTTYAWETPSLARTLTAYLCRRHNELGISKEELSRSLSLSRKSSPEEEKGKSQPSTESRVWKHLRGSIEERHQAIDRHFKHPSLEKAQQLAHEFFSGRRAYEISPDHYLLWTLLHAQKEHFELISSLMKKMVEKQSEYFMAHIEEYLPSSLPTTPTPLKSKAKKGEKTARPAVETLTCYYLGGKKNWERFMNAKKEGEYQGVFYPGLPVTQEQSLDIDNRTTAAIQAIKHCDSLALIKFQAPASSLQLDKSMYSILSSKEVRGVCDDPSLNVVEANKAIRQNIIRTKLTEAEVEQLYPAQASAILSILREEGVLLPLPSPKKSPVSLSPTRSFTPPPIEHKKTPPQEPTPPSPNPKYRLLLGGLVALLLLWKGGWLLQKGKVTCQKILALGK